MQWSTSSTTIAYGGASGTQLASGIAGGWPLPMGHRLVMPSGGRRGSSGVDQGDCLVRQWIHGCVSPGAYAVFFLLFYVKENSDPEVVGLLSGVLRITLNGEVCTVCPQHFPCFRT